MQTAEVKVLEINFKTTDISLQIFVYSYGNESNLRVRQKKSNPITGLDRPWGFQEVEAPRFQDNRHMKVVRLLALRTGSLYPQKNPWYSFLLEDE
jgi:hypothetical protein